MDNKKIKLLENSMINKIAAGEVVERPVSVVKEMIENSIDAGSTQITIEIKDGGTTFIRVTDNGRGIPKEQVATAFLRHATSKIENMDDLENVMSLGFRGEALSSIASVSQVEITTKTISDVTGMRLNINGGIVEKELEVGGIEGTSIVVKNLFYNTPARQKFLKKPSTEGGYISDMVNRFALGHPEVSFKFINNSEIVLQTKGNDDLKTAILQVLGKDVAKNIVELSFNKNNLVFSGFIGKPEISRGNRNHEHFFINGRYIKSEIISSALEQAYKTRLFGGKFPMFVINMSVDPTFVDVNVHPTKLEVRFADSDMVFETIYEAADNALKNSNLIPETSFEPKEKFSNVAKTEVYRPIEKQKSVFDSLFKSKSNSISLKEPAYAEASSEKEIGIVHKHATLEKPSWQHPKDFKFAQGDKAQGDKAQNDKVQNDKIEEKEQISKELETPASKKIVDVNKIKPIFEDYKLVGQLFSTYWIVEQGDSMFVIDQHAAHERILYEELIENLKNKNTSAQKLLQPIILKLSPSEVETVDNNKELLEKFGFEIEDFGERTYAIRSVPFIIKGNIDTSFFYEILDKLSSITSSISDIYETCMETIAMASCKASIRGNDKLTYLEAKELLDKIMALENPFSCPHGRPTIIEMTKYELEKKFKRV